MAIQRNQLKSYAPKARTNFINAVIARAAKFGVTKDGASEMQVQGDVAIIAGQAYPRVVASQRRDLESRIASHGFEQTMEEIAYTWFNRFMAIRYMELHEFLDHGFRVLSHPANQETPEILQQASHVDFPGLDKSKVVDLQLDGTKDEDLYRMLLVGQCNALHAAMPFLFEKIDDETELLLPDHLLRSDSLIRDLVNDIDDENWQEIEVIGWLYQFYISEKKDQVIGKVVKSEDIPAATQLFTPNWIVKYMVQNSLGHQWLATYPSSPLKAKMDYYIEPAEQTEDVQQQLADITPLSLNPEELTLLDPACGSGHILVEAYDLFKEIYLERGYRQRDVPRLILEKNLYGLDIDDRAAQMAGFALLMKARSDDRRILSSENPAKLNVMAIQSSNGLNAEALAQTLLPQGQFEIVASDQLPGMATQPTLAVTETSEVQQGTLASLINVFEDAKTFGSLITVPDNIKQALPALRRLIEQKIDGDYLQQDAHTVAIGQIKPLIQQSEILARQYDAVVANPPYMGSKGMDSTLKEFARKRFSSVKPDLFACFMERCFPLVRVSGSIAMITMHSWMFLSSYEPLRRSIITSKTLMTVAHLGARAFSEISGEVVQTVAFVIKPYSAVGYKPNFLRLIDGNEETKKANILGQKRSYSRLTMLDFNRIPGTPIAYWAPIEIFEAFSSDINIDNTAPPRIGMMTTDNEKFLRQWYEVPINKIGFNYKSIVQAERSNTRWFPYNKGGGSRKWSGNYELVVNWFKGGEAIKAEGMTSFRGKDFYFREGITWSDISTSDFCCRHTPEGFIFDIKGTSCFPNNTETGLIGCLLNSAVGAYILKLLNPTMSYQSGDIRRIPILIHSINQKLLLQEFYGKLVDIARCDWDSFETAWGFTLIPMLSKNIKHSTLSASYGAWETQCTTNIQTMKELEEENNRLFIDAYGLQDELTPDVPEDQITLARADQEQDIKRLISYAIGCMMGRYSLTEPGLIYANAGNIGFDMERYGDFQPDEDGIVPISENDTMAFDDDAAIRFEEFLSQAWSEDTLIENLTFVAEALGGKKSETPRDTIRRYLSKDFFKNHCQTYKKRPIYWLFSSGKEKAFECLVYLHRYNEGTLARMRVEYVTPLQSRISNRIDAIEAEKKSASAAASKTLQKEQDKLVKQQDELRKFDEELRHLADQRITLDLDDGVKVNYGKFGNLLADTKSITGKKKGNA